MTVERQTKPHLAQDQSENLTVQNLQSAITLEQVAKHDQRQTKPHLAQDQSENLTVQNLQSATTLEQVAKQDRRATNQTSSCSRSK
ncbi:hypothetical protein CEXT_441451 [Caerostris extrusa]|uniref:Uncharacterized protein n=1 Tax=Caerostris extrusa TaxID=172846 RepID=A0AAV4PE86_CAEEX|nr:hypothetical protein CEXT_441451 [Caerostris extrusa]